MIPILSKLYIFDEAINIYALYRLYFRARYLLKPGNDVGDEEYNTRLVVYSIKKKCPECGGKAVRLYQNKTVDGKRTWIPTAWYCTECKYIYTVASDTLMYPIGGKEYKQSYHGKCPNCDLKLSRVFRHKNPVHGKQKWISTAWYCTRCKYIWMDKQ